MVEQTGTAKQNQNRTLTISWSMITINHLFISYFNQLLLDLKVYFMRH